jgi:predicted transcriptional regulator
MSTTLTIRLDEAMRDALAKTAEAQGKTVSRLVREILREALAERPLKARAGHLKGALMLREQAVEPWRESLRQRNWRT